jgi:3-oxoacyl-[acyl-carrier protein] reductase
MRMKDETAVITGSTSGIGKKLAEKFLKEGCKVAICSRNEENVNKTVSEFKGDYGDSVIGFPCDVSDIDSVKDVVDKTVATFGSVRILVANAGITLSYGPFEYMSSEKVAEEAKKVIGVNLIGAINSIAACLPQMKKQGYGRIITLSGGGGDRPMPHMTIYSATKGGVVAFSNCLAREFKDAGDDITINIYQPGMIVTNLGSDAKAVEGWKDQATFRKDTDRAFEYMGVGIEESTEKVFPYVLPSYKDNGKTFRGFSIIKMIRGARKLQKEIKKAGR